MTLLDQEVKLEFISMHNLLSNEMNVLWKRARTFKKFISNLQQAPIKASLEQTTHNISHVALNCKTATQLAWKILEKWHADAQSRQFIWEAWQWK